MLIVCCISLYINSHHTSYAVLSHLLNYFRDLLLFFLDVLIIITGCHSKNINTANSNNKKQKASISNNYIRHVFTLSIKFITLKYRLKLNLLIFIKAILCSHPCHIHIYDLYIYLIYEYDFYVYKVNIYLDIYIGILWLNKITYIKLTHSAYTAVLFRGSKAEGIVGRAWKPTEKRQRARQTRRRAQIDLENDSQSIGIIKGRSIPISFDFTDRLNMGLPQGYSCSFQKTLRSKSSEILKKKILLHVPFL